MSRRFHITGNHKNVLSICTLCTVQTYFFLVLMHIIIVTYVVKSFKTLFVDSTVLTNARAGDAFVYLVNQIRFEKMSNLCQKLLHKFSCKIGSITLDPDPDQNGSKILDPDSNSLYLDPQQNTGFYLSFHMIFRSELHELHQFDLQFDQQSEPEQASISFG